MDAVEAGGLVLSSLNHYTGFGAARAGGATELLLAGKELGIAVARFLPSSASTLTVLNLRRVLFCHLGPGFEYIPHRLLFIKLSTSTLQIYHVI